jgi:hypothetical protein
MMNLRDLCFRLEEDTLAMTWTSAEVGCGWGVVGGLATVIGRLLVQQGQETTGNEVAEQLLESRLLGLRQHRPEAAWQDERRCRR